MTEWDAPRVLTQDSWPPNYVNVFGWRQQQILRLKDRPELRYGALEYYRTNPVEFLVHWTDTFDPRLAFEEKFPPHLPFVLFRRQAELVDFVVACLNDQANGLIDKSRDMGATWVCVGISVWLWLFREGSAIGWGSRKEELVDRIGDPKSIFEKIRQMVWRLPRFFWPIGFNPAQHATYMKMLNPENGASIVGEAGNNIGRGGRTLIYFKDEAAFYEHPESIEAALMDNTRVQIDISTVNGVGNVFDNKRQAGTVWSPEIKIPRTQTRVFILDWSDHPEKTNDWHAEREQNARNNGLLHLFRQEVDRDATASLSGIIIKPEWAKAAVDAHLDLKLGTAGGWSAGFDPFDEGGDLHAVSFRKGIVLTYVDDWGDGDVGEATRKVIGETLGRTPITIQYDCIGIGAGVKAEANRLAKEKKLPVGVSFAAWDAGAEVLRPEDRVIRGDSNTPINKDFYGNLKAQAWWSVARRFENTYRARTEGIKFPVEELISISSKIPKLQQLLRELSQPVIKKSGDLRLLVDKKPEGTRSPNMADSVIMNYFPAKTVMHISDEALARFGRRA